MKIDGKEWWLVVTNAPERYDWWDEVGEARTEDEVLLSYLEQERKRLDIPTAPPLRVVKVPTRSQAENQRIRYTSGLYFAVLEEKFEEWKISISMKEEEVKDAH